jgi:hypothetical protein
MRRLKNAPNFRPVIFNVKVCSMSKLVQAASIIALAAVASTAGAWYNAPPAAAMTPEMAEQHAKAMEQAMDAQRRMMEQRAAQFAAMPSGPESMSPEIPPVADFASYPAMPEMPAIPELGPFPEMPDYPGLQGMQGPSAPEHMKTRLDERDAYRAKVQQDMQERRAAFKAMSEQRRAEFKRAVDRTNRSGYAPRMNPAMMSGKDCTPTTQAPEQQATASSPVVQ